MKRAYLVAAAFVIAIGATVGNAWAASAPTAKTGSATQIRQNNAVLNGTVNPDGASTTYYFEVGLTTTYGAATSPLSAGSGVRAKGVSQPAGGLVQGTSYHYRLVATNQFGTTFGADRTLRTSGHAPPGAVTGSAVKVATTGATLTGAVFPGTLATTWWFEWGTSTTYGQDTAAQSFGPNSSAQLAVVPLYVLAPGAIYHFRLVATHPGSATTYGADQTFMTYPSPRPQPAIVASTRTSHHRRRPYVLTTTGSLRLPAWLPTQYACNGDVTIRFFRGPRQVGFTLAGLQPNCAFAARTVFSRIPGGRRSRRPVVLRIVVRSRSNNYVASNRARIEHVSLGGASARRS